MEEDKPKRGRGRPKGSVSSVDFYWRKKNKELFVKNLIAAHGIIGTACSATKIDRMSFKKWYAEDSEFAALVDNAMETAGDYVEGKMYELIEEKNAQVILWYAKTKLKNRGYGDYVDQNQTIKIEQVKMTYVIPEELNTDIPIISLDIEEQKKLND